MVYSILDYIWAGLRVGMYSLRDIGNEYGNTIREASDMHVLKNLSLAELYVIYWYNILKYYLAWQQYTSFDTFHCHRSLTVYK